MTLTALFWIPGVICAGVFAYTDKSEWLYAAVALIFASMITQVAI